MSHPVTRSERRRDLLALALLAVGAAVYAYGYAGLHRMAQHPAAARAGRTAVEQTTIYWNISRGGVALLAVGIAVVAWSCWRHLTRTAPTHP